MIIPTTNEFEDDVIGGFEKIVFLNKLWLNIFFVKFNNLKFNMFLA